MEEEELISAQRGDSDNLSAPVRLVVDMSRITSATSESTAGPRRLLPESQMRAGSEHLDSPYLCPQLLLREEFFVMNIKDHRTWLREVLLQLLWRRWLV